MCQDRTKEKLETDKLLLKLHLKYILSISFACICLVIVLSFCEDSTFKNCVSVSSTVTSIILSVIAIILSVTGERTTNEIRNKVSDSVIKLEDCTDKSSELTLELSTTLQQLNALYEGVNDNIIKIPKIESTLNEFVLKNGENINNGNENEVADNVASFLNNLGGDMKENMIRVLSCLQTSTKETPVEFEQTIKYLVSCGTDTQSALLAYGYMMGILMTGQVSHISTIDRILEKINE